MADISNYIAGGYILTRRTKTPSDLSGGLLPETFLSASHCLVDIRRGIGGWTGGTPEKLGVPKEKLPEVETWTVTEFRKKFGFPNIFYTLDSVQAYIQKFIPEPPDDLVILCHALHTEQAEQFLKTEQEMNDRGIYETLVRRDAPAAGGIILGYEPLCFGYDLDHTWLCNGLHKDAFSRWHIKPNEQGFLDNSDDARKVSEAALPDGAEDGLWLPWLIIQYPINHTG